MNENDIKTLIQELMKAQLTWQKDVVIAMYNEIERLKKLLESK
jgi:hypothetical protein